MNPVNVNPANMSEETLVLYYYDEGLSPGERAAVAAALKSDAALAERYRALCRSLERFGEPSPVAARPQAVARWHRSIERAAAAEARPRGSGGKQWHFPSFAWGALAAAVVLAVAVRAWLADGVPATPQPQDERVAGDPPAAPRAVPAAFSRGLEVHLRDSRRGLLGLAGDGDADRRLLLEDIIRQNRQFERAALDHDADDVARVLRAFEPILVRLANEDISAEDAAALRSKLLFELNVMLTKMSASESQDAQTI